MAGRQTKGNLRAQSYRSLIGTVLLKRTVPKGQRGCQRGAVSDPQVCLVSSRRNLRVFYLEQAMDKENHSQYKVITFLKRDELDFLDNLEKDLYFKHGINIPRTKLLEEIINIVRDMEEKDRKALEDQLLRMFKEEKGKGGHE
jgi:hypothetical protein